MAWAAPAVQAFSHVLDTEMKTALGAEDRGERAVDAGALNVKIRALRPDARAVAHQEVAEDLRAGLLGKRRVGHVDEADAVERLLIGASDVTEAVGGDDNLRRRLDLEPRPVEQRAAGEDFAVQPEGPRVEQVSLDRGRIARAHEHEPLAARQ